MRKLIVTLALLAGTAAAPAPARAAGPNWPTKGQEKKEAFTLIDSAELEKRLAAKDSKVKVYDVNTLGFRESNGIIPGAVQLSSFEKYSAFDMPEDKETPLVFYCVNAH